MHTRSIALGIAGFGAAVILFAVVMWIGNRPDFYQTRMICGLFGSPNSTQAQECVQERKKEGDAANALYTSCLFSSRYALCQGVTAIPYISIAGIMILLAGGGLFAFSRPQRRTS